MERSVTPAKDRALTSSPEGATGADCQTSVAPSGLDVGTPHKAGITAYGFHPCLLADSPSDLWDTLYAGLNGLDENIFASLGELSRND